MSEQIKDGGPAFPIKGYCVDASGAFCGEIAKESGMALRDYFAAKAMQAMLGSDLMLKHTDKMCDVVPDFHRGRWIAEQAYKFSDAMLTARGDA